MDISRPDRRALLAAAPALLAAGAAGAGAIRFSAGARVVCLGDSIIEAMNGGGDPAGKGVQSLARGEAVLAQALDPRFNLDTWPDASRTGHHPPTYFWGSNQGVGGEPSAGALARAPLALALAPDILVVATGTNDLQDPAAVVAHVDAICALAARARPNAVTVVATIRPVVKGAPPAGPRPLDRLRAANDGLRALASRRPRVLLWDAYAALAGPDGWGLPEDFEDGLHPSPAGALKSGALAPTSLRAVLAQVVAQGDVAAPLFPHNLAAPLGVGSEPAVSPGVSGEVCAGLQVVRAGGWAATATLTCAVRPGPAGPAQEIRVRTSGDGAAVQVFVIRPKALALPPATGLGGAWVRLWADMAFDGWPGWLCPNATLSDRSDPARRAVALAGGQDRWIAGARTIRLLTPAIPLSPASAGALPSIAALFRPTPGEGVARLLRWGVARTPDPRPLYAA